MGESLESITHKSRLLLSGQYVEKLYKEIDEMEKYIEVFSERMKSKLNSCRAELRECESETVLSSEVRRNIKCLHYDFDESNSQTERENILKEIQSELANLHLPILETNTEFGEFLKQDHCPVKLLYAGSEETEYENDFEDEEHDSSHLKTRESKGDQVDGTRKTAVARTNISGTAAEHQLAARSKVESVIFSSEEVSEDSIHARTQTKHPEIKRPATPKKSKQYRATRLQDLTESSQYTLNKKEEVIFSFPELKHHLSEGMPIPPVTQPAPDVKVIKSGDLELPTCADVKLFDTYIITATDENIIKVDKKTNKPLGKLHLLSLGKMCFIRKSSFIGVIQTNSFITVVSTDPELKPVYKIKTSKAYTNICHVDTYVNTPRNQPDPSYTFGLVYTDTSSGNFSEKVDLVKAATTVVYQKIPQYDAQADAFDLRPYDISGISGIGAIWYEKTLRVILGGATKIICLEKAKSQIKKTWEIAIDKAATDVVCVDSMAYICVQDEGRIMLVDINGKVKNENVLHGLLQCRPHKVSVRGDILLVKSFEESVWKNLVFAKQKTTNV